MTPFKPPTVDEVRDYARHLGVTINPYKFCSFYESKGWMVGRNKMKSWQAAVCNWCADQLAAKKADEEMAKRKAKEMAEHQARLERGEYITPEQRAELRRQMQAAGKPVPNVMKELKEQQKRCAMQVGLFKALKADPELEKKYRQPTDPGT